MKEQESVTREEVENPEPEWAERQFEEQSSYGFKHNDVFTEKRNKRRKN